MTDDQLMRAGDESLRVLTDSGSDKTGAMVGGLVGTADGPAGAAGAVVIAREVPRVSTGTERS